MFFTSANFIEFEIFKNAASYWDLDFRLLSKNDFSGDLSLFSNRYFQLGRTAISGKVEQKGLCPIGFRSFVIPVNYEVDFYWLNKKVSGNQLMIFPKNGTLDGVSFNDFDVYVVSIEEEYLLNKIEQLGNKNITKLLNGDEQRLFLKQSFSEQFHILASEFLLICRSEDSFNSHVFQEKIDNIIHKLLKYIELQNRSINDIIPRKRDIGLKKAIDLINHQLDESISIGKLCQSANLSERTLEYAFREKYQVTPKQYIKALKLHKIRQDLSQSEFQNISATAARYGFWHMGQFAADFKKQFGILPSQTNKK